MRKAKDFAPFQRIVLAYLLFSLLWILLSDYAVELLLPHDLQHTAQTWKGWFFVGVTTVLLYGLLRRVHRQMQEAAAQELEAAQREARAALLLNAVVGSSSDAIFAKDRLGRYLLFNPAAEAVTGRREQEVLGRDDHVVFPPEQAEQIKANDRAVMDRGSIETYEELLDTVQGPRTFLATKGALRDDEGIKGMFGVARDISDMVRVREALRVSERRYRQMFETSPLAMWVHDAQTHRFLDVNAAALALYGYGREAFLGMTLDDIQPSAQLAALHQMFSDGEQRAAGSRFHRCQDGHVIEVDVSICPFDFDGTPAHLTLALDVSARNRLQRERDAAGQRLSNVLARVTDAFVAIDRGQRLTYVNDRAAQWFAPGVPAQQLQGRLVWDLVPEAVGTLFQDAVQQALDTGQQTVAEGWYPPWQRWMELRMYPSAQGATGYFTDVTARRSSEEALKQSQRELSALSQQLLQQEQVMLQGLAQSLHDRLGQQLGSARLYLDVVAAQTPAAADATARLAGALDAAIREVREVLRDLRPPLLKEQGLPAALDNELLHSPARMLGVSTQLLLADPVRELRWPDDVEYAFFMIAREAIANALRHAQARQLTVQLDGDARRLHLQVQDDGVGLADGVLQGVPGHLGLVGMRERALAVGAVLSVALPAGQGTLVDVTLNLDATPRAAEP